MMNEFRYEKTDKDYILYFPELLNVHIPFKQYIGPDTTPIKITDKMMEELVYKLNTGEIKLYCDDMEITEDGVKYKLSSPDTRKLKIIFDK